MTSNKPKIVSAAADGLSLIASNIDILQGIDDSLLQGVTENIVSATTEHLLYQSGIITKEIRGILLCAP
jgi:hypothetical protein